MKIMAERYKDRRERKRRGWDQGDTNMAETGKQDKLE